MPALYVVGSCNTDLVIRVPTLPRPGETVSGGRFARFQGGKGANQAVAAARLAPPSIAVRFTGAVGDDGFGERALEALASEGLDVSSVQRLRGVATGVAFLQVDEKGENSIAVAPGANHELTPDHVEAGMASARPGDLLLLSMELNALCIRSALASARARGLRILLNPAPVPRGGFDPELLDYADVLTPNRLELSELSRVEHDEAWPPSPNAIRRLRSQREIDVVVTGGAEGVCADLCAREERSAERLLIAPPSTEFPVRDTVGAGDCFAGALAVALLEERPWPAALRFAVQAAAISVTRDGAQASMPRRDEVLASLEL